VALAAFGVCLLHFGQAVCRAEEIRLDDHVLWFSLRAALLSGLLFGLTSAWSAPARDLERTLRAGGLFVASACGPARAATFLLRSCPTRFCG
jgi:hypothetical protein